MPERTKADAILEKLQEIAKILGMIDARTKAILGELAVPDGLEDPPRKEGG